MSDEIKFVTNIEALFIIDRVVRKMVGSPTVSRTSRPPVKYARVRSLLCYLLTFGRHWWKHFPGKSRYVCCRICHRLPKSQWAQLQEMRKERG